MQWPIPPFPTKTTTPASVFVGAAGTANVKGSWTTIATGLDSPISWINLGTDRITTAGDRAVLLDLAIGGAGSETVVASNLLFGYRPHRGTLFPLHVPAGATLRARISCGIAGRVIYFSPTCFTAEPDSGITVPGRISSYGTVAATSGGTLITPSGTANVKGSYSELTSSTTSPIHALMVLAQGSTATQTTQSYLIDIAVGGAGSETVIIPNVRVEALDDEYVYPVSPEF